MRRGDIETITSLILYIYLGASPSAKDSLHFADTRFI